MHPDRKAARPRRSSLNAQQMSATPTSKDLSYHALSQHKYVPESIAVDDSSAMSKLTGSLQQCNACRSALFLNVRCTPMSHQDVARGPQGAASVPTCSGGHLRMQNARAGQELALRRYRRTEGKRNGCNNPKPRPNAMRTPQVHNKATATRACVGQDKQDPRKTGPRA